MKYNKLICLVVCIILGNSQIKSMQTAHASNQNISLLETIREEDPVIPDMTEIYNQMKASNESFLDANTRMGRIVNNLIAARSWQNEKFFVSGLVIGLVVGIVAYSLKLKYNRKKNKTEKAKADHEKQKQKER